MKRLITKKLLSWKNNKNHKPLVITGVRQCGKTYICKNFGEQYFEDTAYFNFDEDERLISIFEPDKNVDRILDDLEVLIYGKKIEAGKTLVIFDEIQVCPKAISALKYFCEKKRELHIIAAGSLLGVAIRKHQESFPVGKVNSMRLQPMSFLEFMWAELGEEYEAGLRKYALDAEIPAAYTQELERCLKHYYMVGGMPEAVLSWVTSHDMAQVEEIQDEILSAYAIDFAKHAPTVDIPKLGWIWDSVPQQLAKENNKFVFSHVKAGKRAADLEDAMHWLLDAGMIYKLDMVETPNLPLASVADSTSFKIYFCDVGLLRRKASVPWRILLENDGSYSNFRGAFTENFVMSELLALELQPYFWRSGNTAELDFLLDYEGHIVPIEAKATIHTRAKSYLQFCKRYSPEIGFRISMKNVGMNEVESARTISLPLYMTWRLKEYLSQSQP